MYAFIRPLLFHLDPERAHQLTLSFLRWAGQSSISRLLNQLFEVNDPRLSVEAFGLKFKNPIGLAAGYDKNGVAVGGLSALGFGHIEVGTVTRLPQPGHPRPRVQRVPEARAVINAMGFPNEGVEALRVASGRWQVAGGREAWQASLVTRIGINIGKGKDTPLEQAAEDYGELLQQVHGRADYVTINVSSPNTLNLRQLQARAAMEDLLKAIAAVRNQLTPRVSVLVKIAPDLSEPEIDDVLAAVTACGMDGIIATNTTVSREGLPDYTKHLKGGLSGAPLRARATEVIRYLARRTPLPIIGVGGIMNADDALEKLDAGARLIQIYTGLIYAGPGLVRAINQAIVRRKTNAYL